MSAESSLRTGVLVIGAGPGGYVAAIRAAQLGVDATLVEKDAYGGVCLNHGCIPSKALVSATGLAERAAAAGEMGVDADVSTDLQRMTEWKDGIVDRLTGGVERLCRANGVRLVEGRAAFVDETEARVHGGSDAPDRIAFEHAVVATGSRPAALPGFDFDDQPVWSSREALSATTVPDRLLVVGAGYIGMELSTVFATLGSDVTVVEALDSVLPGYEDDVTAVVRDRAEELGIDFRVGETAEGWTAADDGVRVTTGTDLGETGSAADRGAESDDTTVYEADRVLVAVGREPVTDTLALGNAGVDTDDEGFVETNRCGRTTAETVYAIGDVAGEPMLAHAASAEGIVAARDIAGEPPEIDDWIVPAAVFTDPEIGTVGMTAAEAEAAGFDAVVGEFPFSASGRAMTTGRTDGFVRIVAAAGSGALLGARVVGPEAAELVAELAFAIGRRATLADLAETIHVHPTLAEAVGEAAENALGRAIHTTN
jgi:dihydrolipoamide dehydrogenase